MRDVILRSARELAMSIILDFYTAVKCSDALVITAEYVSLLSFIKDF